MTEMRVLRRDRLGRWPWPTIAVLGLSLVHLEGADGDTFDATARQWAQRHGKKARVRILEDWALVRFDG